ncbi:MAG: DOMON domain-containing protein, partial [Candidatus Bipolaricaulota bacterium]|nr:DOMON domain-containing protein [Candidatus Bipolaricaulota bacterium]
TTGISVFWQNDATILYVGLVSPGTGWVGIGFDPDVRMQGADILIAAVVDGALVIQDQFGVAQTFHNSDAQQNIIQAVGTESNGSTFIEFARPLSSGDSVDKALTPGQAVTIIVALQQSDDSFTAHHTARTTTTITLDGGM